MLLELLQESDDPTIPMARDAAAYAAATREVAKETGATIVDVWTAFAEKAGWKKKSGEIKNLELIKDIYTLYQTLKNKVQVLHVNGHVGVQGNELADRMSILAIQSRETDFALYREPLDIAAILATRAG